MEKKLPANAQKFWMEYLDSLPEKERRHPKNVEASYAGSAQITDELIDLYIAGKKHAGSSVVEDFQSAGDPLPQVGNYWIVLDSSNNPRLILKTIKIVLNKFKDITNEIAIAEGEGDLSVEHWKKAHSDFYIPNLKKWGVPNLDEATIITEFFEIVHQ